MKMLQVGGIATGKDFFDREKEVGDVVESLGKDNVLLVAPRRYGKTSVMKEVERKLTDRGYLCLHLDVMGVYSPQKFVVALANAAFDVPEMRESFLEKLKAAFVHFGERLQELEISLSGVKAKFNEGLREEMSDDNWDYKGRDVFNALSDISDKKPIFVVIDELSECINNMKNSDGETARKFLQWLRSIRQTMFEDLRFIVGGSMCFDRVVENAGSPSGINDLKRIYIGGFSEGAALKFIKKAFEDNKEKYSEEIGQKILKCVGEPYIPYFIAVFLSMISREDGELSERDIEEIYSSKLLGAYGRGHFDYYWQRLKIYYNGVLVRAARDILRESCLPEEGLSKALAFDLFQRATGIEDEDKFMDLLHDLENDFYIKFDGKNIRFQSKVLRDWWRLYHV
jgi:AAA+ ATPase superfamily predicted ATPase